MTKPKQPPTTSTTIRLGDRFLINRTTPGGSTLPELWTVTELRRGLIRMKNDRGEELNMMH